MIQADFQSLAPGAIVELFELHLSDVEVLYFHPGTNGMQAPVVFGGQAFTPLPVEADGFEANGRGQQPRPKIKLANTNGLFSPLIKQYKDLTGCKVVRRRTFAKYLDAVNFPGGVNPQADPTAEMPSDVFFVNQKTAENKNVIEFELAPAFDTQGVKIPLRQILSDTCTWKYRDPNTCAYLAPQMYDFFNQPTNDPAKDRCPRTIDGCAKRFGDQPLRFSGFPGAKTLPV